jgi:hypothetical protein
MQTESVNLPSWSVHVLVAVYHNWAIVVAALLSGLVVSAAVAYRKHRYTLKQGIEYGQAKLHILLLGVSAVFTGIQYYLPFLHDHLRTLETLPYIGGYVVSIYAAANFVYAIKAKTWFTKLWNTAEKLDSMQVTLPTPVAQPLAQATTDAPETAADFAA